MYCSIVFIDFHCFLPIFSSSSEDITSEEEDDIDSESEEESSSKTGWSLACSLASEWEELAESFKKSKNRDEKLLFQTLSEDFVPEIGKMIEAKVSTNKYQGCEIRFCTHHCSNFIATSSTSSVTLMLVITVIWI